MSNRADTGDADEDKRTSDLLALLYPEDGADVDGSAYEGDEELAGLRDLRAMLAGAGDEDPSDAVSNKLLALAAQHAPKPKVESRGLFAWLGNLMMPLVAHPGLAAAATLVLVAGVAGTLYIKGDVQIAEPTASSRGASPGSEAVLDEATAIAPSPDPSATATDSLSAEVAEEPAEERAEGLAEQAPADGTGSGRSSRAAAETAKSQKRDKSRAAKPAVVGGSAGYGYQDEREDGAGAEQKRKAPARKSSLKVKDIDTRDFSGSSNNPSAGNVSAPPPPPQAEPAPSKGSTRSAPSAPSGDAEADADKKSESKSQEAARLHEQARIAAKNNDCTRVLALGQQIRKLDGAYYDRQFLSDAALKSCRASANKKSTISK